MTVKKLLIAVFALILGVASVAGATGPSNWGNSTPGTSTQGTPPNYGID
ncbi:hypothetical protein Q0M94_04225 [Deinococcus radiomollis]